VPVSAPGDAAAAQPAVRRLALAQTLSLAGADATGVALSFVLFLRTGSAAWLSAGLLVSFGLTAVLGPVGGQLADRLDRRRLLVGADLAAAVPLTGMACTSEPVALLGLSAAATAVSCAAAPAGAAALPNIAGPRRLAWANGLLGTTGNIGKTAGRALGGVAVAAGGPGPVFLATAGLRVLAGTLVLGIRRPFGGRDPGRSPSAPVTRLPLREARAHPTLRLVTTSSCIATFLTAFTMVAETPLALGMGAGATGLGLLTASWTLGMVAGSAAAGRILTPETEPAGLMAGRCAMGVGLASVALAPLFWSTLASYLVAGAAGGFLLVASAAMLQRCAADDVRGRALALADSLKAAAFAAGMLLAGVIVDAVAPQAVFAVVGAGVLLSAVPAWLLTRAAAASGVPQLAGIRA
jgi:MFS family permease